jgi:hypothetical protein
MQKDWKKYIFDVLAGAMLISVAGVSTGWIVTRPAAERAAQQRAVEAVDARLAKICVHQFQVSPNLNQRLNKLRKLEYSWARARYIKDHDWSTMPDKSSPSPGVADNCARLLLKMKSRNP